MYESLPQHNVMSYSVQVGHARVTVTGCSREEVVGEARRLLCLEMPRMWDVIQGLEDNRFQVALLR